MASSPSDRARALLDTYTRDISRAMAFARDVDAGQVFINQYFAGGVPTPFGGTKMSGNAREGLHETLLDMTEQKTLLMSGVFPA